MPNYNGVWSLSTQYQYNTDWQADNISPARAAATTAARGLFALGKSQSAPINPIDQINTVSEGNATDFGDLTAGRQLISACSNSIRGIYAGGGASASNVIDFVVITTTGNASDFGDLTANAWEGAGCCSSHGGIA